MPAFTTLRAGNWSDANPTTSPWSALSGSGPGGVPGNGDTVTITHAVTVNADTTVGTSPANQTTFVLTLSGANARLHIAPGVTLTLRGNVQNYVNTGSAADGVTLGAGSKIWMDPSQSASPTTQSYIFRGAQYSRILARGTAEARAVIGTLPGNYGPANFINYSGVAGSCFDAEYLTVERMGSAATKCVASTANAAPYSTYTRFVDCVFDSCGEVDVVTNSAATGFTFLRCETRNSKATLAAVFGCVAGATGTTQVTRSVFDKKVAFSCPANMVVEECVFRGDMYTTATTGGGDRSFQRFKNNLIAWDGLWDTPEASITDSYMLLCNTGTNPGGMGMAAQGANREFSRNVIDLVQDVITGDIIRPSTNAGLTLAFKNNIGIPNCAKRSGGNLLSIYSEGTSLAIAIEHNTYVTFGAGSGQTDMISVGENDTGVPGEITSLKSNLVWTPDAQTPGFLMARRSTNKQDYVLPANCTHNYGYRQAVGNNVMPSGPKYGFKTNDGQTALMFSSDLPANACVECGNPDFVDPWRNLATYDTVKLGRPLGPTWDSYAAGHSFAVGDKISNTDAAFYGGTAINFRCIAAHVKSTANSEPGVGKEANGAATWTSYWEFYSLQECKEAALAGGTPVADLVGWVKDGFRPRNVVLRGTAHDGGDAGAMPVAGRTAYIAGHGQGNGLG